MYLFSPGTSHNTVVQVVAFPKFTFTTKCSFREFYSIAYTNGKLDCEVSALNIATVTERV